MELFLLPFTLLHCFIRKLMCRFGKHQWQKRLKPIWVGGGYLYDYQRITLCRWCKLRTGNVEHLRQIRMNGALTFVKMD